MATYLELYALRNNQALVERTAVAIAKAAQTISAESDQTTNHANRMVWARQAMSDPLEMGQQILWLVLAANSGLTVAQITSATDSDLQTAVTNVVNLMAGTA